MKFHDPKMTCGHCTAAIEKGTNAEDFAAVFPTNLKSHLMAVTSTLLPAECARGYCQRRL